MSAEWEGGQRWLEKAAHLQGLADFSDIFVEIIDEVVIPEVKEQLDSEGRGQYPNPKLSKVYERRKRRLYGDRPILQATGVMYRAFTVPGAPHQIREVGPDAALYGVDLARAKFHQRGKGKLPQRKIINLTREFRRKARERAQKRLNEQAQRIMRG